MFNALASHWNLPGNWDDGDFNYDGIVNANDLGLLSYNWQQGTGAPLGSSLSSALTSLGIPIVSIPEPTLFLTLFPMIASSLFDRAHNRLKRPRRARLRVTPIQNEH